MVLSAACAGAQPAMFRGDAAHTGVYAGAGVAAFGGLQWRVQTNGPVRGSPTVAGGIVYVGSGDGSVYAIDETSGAVRWRRSVGSAISSTPAVADGLVFVSGYDGSIVALRATSGEVAWTYRTGAPVPLKWGYESGETWISSPVLAGGLVVVGARDGKVHALEPRTGAAKWTYDAGARVYSSPAAAGGTVFVGGQDGVLHAIDLASGRSKWRFSTNGATLKSSDFGFDRTTIQSSPSVADGVVYVGARDGWIYAVDAATGVQRWNYDHEVSWINTSIAVSDGMLFDGSSDAHFIQALDSRTGAERWRAKSVGIVWGSPAVDRERVYIGEGNGTIHALDKATGREAWHYRVGQRVMSSPVLHDGRLFVGSDDGAVYAINGGSPLRRAVYWDSTYLHAPLSVSSEPLRTWLAGRGYEVLDAEALGRFMADRVRDRAPSVVVFAMGYLPPSVAPVAADTVLFRRYLDAGGTAVWIGGPPMLAGLKISSLKEIDRTASKRLIGIGYENGNFDPVGVTRVTPEGQRLGLPAWWLDTWGADTADVTAVLAYDEQGNAAAWVKRFGGPAGTGFIRIPASDGAAGRPWDFMAVQAVAELRPR